VMTTVPLAAFLVLSLFALGLATTVLLLTGDRGATATHPSEVEGVELNASYRALLAAHDELARALTAGDDHSPETRALLDRSRDTVVLCGKVARIASRGERYLALHAGDPLGDQARQLRARAADCLDDDTRAALEGAALARERQAAVVSELARSHARTLARIEHARASIEALGAGLVGRQIADATALALAADSIEARAAELEAELEAIAAT